MSAEAVVGHEAPANMSEYFEHHLTNLPFSLKDWSIVPHKQEKLLDFSLINLDTVVFFFFFCVIGLLIL